MYQFFFILYFILVTVILPILILPFAIIYKILLPNHCNTWEYVCKLSLNLLNVKYINIGNEKLIDKGYILSNHRSFIDFSYDAVMTKSSIVGRYLVYFTMSFLSILGFIDNRLIAFHRGKTNRKDIMKKINNHFDKKGLFCQRILFYPEGTRKNYKNLSSPDDFKKNHLKFGLLKEIYEQKLYPVQIFITSNKENIINEKQLYLSYNKTLKSKLCSPIYPEKYEIFDDFINEICKSWYEAYIQINI